MHDWAKIQEAWLNPGANGENLRFRDFPSFHLMTLANLAKADVSRACLEPAGLSMPEWRLLTALEGGGDVPISQIASQTLMDKGLISRTLRTAQGKGLVETEVLPLERRPNDAAISSIGRVMVRITKAGRETYEKAMPLAQLSQLRLLELMTPQERLIAVDLARRFYQRLVLDLQGRS